MKASFFFFFCNSKLERVAMVLSRLDDKRLFNFEHGDMPSSYYKIHSCTMYEPFFDTQHLRLLCIEYAFRDCSLTKPRAAFLSWN